MSRNSGNSLSPQIIRGRDTDSSLLRPEKEHAAQIRAFKLFLDAHPNLRSGVDFVRLVLVGGCRTKEDEKRVEDLKELAVELGVQVFISHLECYVKTC